MFRVDYFCCMFSRIFRELLCSVSERILKKHLKQTLQKIQKTRNIAPPKGAGHLDQKNSGFWRHIFRYFFQFRKSSKWPRKKLKFGTLFGVKKRRNKNQKMCLQNPAFFWSKWLAPFGGEFFHFFRILFNVCFKCFFRNRSLASQIIKFIHKKAGFRDSFWGSKTRQILVTSGIRSGTPWKRCRPPPRVSRALDPVSLHGKLKYWRCLCCLRRK